MSLGDFIVLFMAAWRMAHLLMEEDGPFRIFERIRDWLIPPGELVGFFPTLLTCLWCLSIWTFGVSWLVWQFTTIPVIILAGSAAVMMWNRVFTGET